ncbi:unnamed protein product [Blepharisma stoltei]|uniref:Uncharacterized protein n=1 Tax=Blepharisma stoltei TaxID=1481888 RepID=A0AAU9JR00_9CILI|nr:unnamed protein product [Blepharisma stoltei]
MSSEMQTDTNAENPDIYQENARNIENLSFFDKFDNERISVLEKEIGEKDQKILAMQTAHFNEKIKLQTQIFELKKRIDKTTQDPVSEAGKAEERSNEAILSEKLGIKTKQIKSFKKLHCIDSKRIQKLKENLEETNKSWKEKISALKSPINSLKEEIQSVKTDAAALYAEWKISSENEIKRYMGEFSKKNISLFNIKDSYEKLYLSYQSLSWAFQDLSNAQKAQLDEIAKLQINLKNAQSENDNLKLINFKLIDQANNSQGKEISSQDLLNKILETVRDCPQVDNKNTREIQNENDSLREKARRLEMELKYKNHKLKELLAKPIEIYSAFSHKPKNFNKEHEELTNFRLQKCKLDAEVAYLHERMQELEEKDRSLRIELEEKIKENAYLLDELGVKNSTINEMQVNLDENLAKVQLYHQELAKLQNLNSAMSNEISNSKIDYENIEKMFSSFDKNIKQVSFNHISQLNQITDEKNTLYLEYKKLQNEYENSKTQLENQIVLYRELQQQNKNALNLPLIASSDITLESKNKEIADLQLQLNEAKEAIAQNEQYTIFLLSHIDQANQKIQNKAPSDTEISLKSELDSLLEKLSIYENDLHEEKEKSENLRKNNLLLEQELKKRKNSALNKANDEKDIRAEMMENEIKSLKEIVEKQQREFMIKELELLTTNSEIPDIEELNRRYNNEIIILKEINEKEKQEFNKEIEEYKRKSDKITDEHEKETQDYENKVQKLQNQVKTLRDVLITKRTDQSSDTLRRLILSLHKVTKII